MPGKKFFARLPRLMCGYRYGRTIQTIVASTVPELLTKAVADTKNVVCSDCHVSEVIETMKIAAKQEAIIHAMFAA
ncbi:MAG TPA: hypothetical protein VGA23_06080 [Methylomirabilota bacterium]